MNWTYFLAFFIGSFLLRAVYYYYKLVRIQELKTYYFQYLKDRDSTFLQHRPQIISLFKEAKLSDFVITHTEAAGYGQIRNITTSGFANIANNRSDIAATFIHLFEEAIGTFREKMNQSFNPFYWIEFMVKLPQIILSYINFSPPNSIMNIIQLVYWTIGILVAFDKFQIIDILSWLK